jgi:hypothetical protein
MTSHRVHPVEIRSVISVANLQLLNPRNIVCAQESLIAKSPGPSSPNLAKPTKERLQSRKARAQNKRKRLKSESSRHREVKRRCLEIRESNDVREVSNLIIWRFTDKY